MNARGLMLGTPVAAVVIVALGLHVGSGGSQRAAVVFVAPRSAAGTGVTMQALVETEDHGARAPEYALPVKAIARSGHAESVWSGVTDEDGTIEMRFDLPTATEVMLELRAANIQLARGLVEIPESHETAARTPAWVSPLRREGPIRQDVAVLGGVASSGFPAVVWVRATDDSTGEGLPNVMIEPEADASLHSDPRTSRTDASGWARFDITPTGHAVALTLRAHAGGAGTGLWIGAFPILPGAAHSIMADRVAPDVEAVSTLMTDGSPRLEHLEIDDAFGRAWATSVRLEEVTSGARPSAVVRLPTLRPGLYWLLSSDSAVGVPSFGLGTNARPFFVAESDDAALALGGARDACSPRPDVRSAASTVSLCLAQTAAVRSTREVAIDGFAFRRTQQAARRTQGLGLAVAGVAIAAILEAVLLVATAKWARSGELALAEAGGPSLGGSRWRARRAGSAAVAILVGLLGFVLLGALLVQLG